jgi:hypothetical protein
MFGTVFHKIRRVTALMLGKKNPENRNNKYQRQTGELYEGLGRFVEGFELLVDAMRTELLFTWNREGLIQTQGLYRTALAELTAYPIKGVFVATMAELAELTITDSAEHQHVDKVLKYINLHYGEMVEVRNEIVHGTWRIGWASEKDLDFSVADGVKPTNTKSGVAHRDISRSKEDFYQLVDECNMLKCVVQRLGGTLRHNRSITANFPMSKNEVQLEQFMWNFKPLISNYDGAISKKK